jgi:hypothetical protein
MMYKEKVAVCSEIRIKHSTQSEHHVEFLNVKPGGWHVKKSLGFRRLMFPPQTERPRFVETQNECYTVRSAHV